MFVQPSTEHNRIPHSDSRSRNASARAIYRPSCQPQEKPQETHSFLQPPFLLLWAQTTIHVTRSTARLELIHAAFPVKNLVVYPALPLRRPPPRKQLEAWPAQATLAQSLTGVDEIPRKSNYPLARHVRRVTLRSSLSPLSFFLSQPLSYAATRLFSLALEQLRDLSRLSSLNYSTRKVSAGVFVLIGFNLL